MRFTTLRHPVVAFRRARVLPQWVRRIDRAVNRSINASPSWDLRDRGYRRLSRAADHGVLWYVAGGTLLVLGFGRGALRGVASMAVASALSDLVVKRIYGGPRPVFHDVPAVRQLKKYPSTASFTSGHSASAAAFATGVAVESPAAGAVVGPLAAAVAYSRLHVGAHWLSDVVGGVAIGATVALIGRLLVPARRLSDDPEPEVAQVVEPILLPASLDGEGVIIMLNADAGTSVIRFDPRPVIAERLPKAVLRELGPDETLDAAVREAMAADNPPRVLGVYGGDGSVSRMAHLAREFDLPLFALPGGTFNHFVRAAGIDSVDVAISALQTGAGVAASVGELTTAGRSITVLNAASIGLYPDFVAQRARRRARLGKWFGGVAATWRELRDAEAIDIELDGTQARVWSVFASVGRNTPGHVATMQRQTLSDDVLDVRILHARGSRLQAVASLSFGKATRTVLRTLRLLPPASDVEHITTRQIQIHVLPRHGRATFYAHDGELERRPAVDEDGRYTLSCVIVPSALRVYAPHPEPGESGGAIPVARS
ncbi:bifunctional phosphatase PAP2/diacylglycerol kinase family protein [Micromonospora sp. DT81.3]|uniref:bifunctional phosphatase PAP2/diacylglycerol kinase family protein n=1 Tax=Micromonospora sp. DT81.3 TaxID=3416523 RepID=UPI003CF7FAC2